MLLRFLLFSLPSDPRLVCVCGVTGRGCGGRCEEEGLRPRGGGETHRCGSDGVAVMRWCVALTTCHSHPWCACGCVRGCALILCFIVVCVSLLCSVPRRRAESSSPADEVSHEPNIVVPVQQLATILCISSHMCE